jgi:hypothetical protein
MKELDKWKKNWTSGRRIGQVEEELDKWKKNWTSRHPPYCFHLSNVFRSVQIIERR